MGIKSLLKFINEFPELIKIIDKNTLKKKKIAIDISILIYRSIISVRSSGADFTNQKGEITSHILGLFNKTIEILQLGIIPVYVFDGKPPTIKYKTIEGRKIVRKKALEKMETAISEEDKIKYFKRSAQITKEQWDQCRDLLDMMGIPYINAPEEADSQCAYLAKVGLVEAVLTEDMDILTFGSTKIIRNLTSHKVETTEIVLTELLDKLDLSYEQFVEFCILLGSDYCSGIIDTKPKIIYEYYKKNKDITKTLEELSNNDIKFPEETNYEEIKTYFTKPVVNEITGDYIKLKIPDTAKLLKKLVEEYGLIKYLIKSKLDKLMGYYNDLSTNT
jgi:flap endonuclease-1